jgi:hypothetical protein
MRCPLTPTLLSLQQEYPAYALAFKYMMQKHIVEFGSLSLGAAAQQGVLKALPSSLFLVQ